MSTSVAEPSRKTRLRDSTHLPRASTARPERRSRTKESPTLKSTMAPTMTMDLTSPIAPETAAMTKSWMLRGFFSR